MASEQKRFLEGKASDRRVITEADERCGFFCWHPRFLRPFAHVNLFTLVFIVHSLLVGMLYTLWISSISTIEKRFHLPSKLVGAFGSVGEIGGLIALIFCAHFGGAGHRPRWLGFASIFIAFSSFLLVLPEYLAPLPSFPTMSAVNKTATFDAAELCERRSGDRQSLDGTCAAQEEGAHGAEQMDSATLITCIVVFIVGHLMLNTASSAPWVIGTPFIHDNVRLQNASIYYAILFLGRMGGPVFGFMLGSYATSIYVSPGNEPEGLTPRDPQWIGAWHIGFIVTGIGQIFCAFFFLWFPRQVRRVTPAERAESERRLREHENAAVVHEKGQNAIDSTDGAPKRYDDQGQRMLLVRKARLGQLPRDLKHLLCNPALVFMAIGRAVDMLSIMGFFMFSPKYLEQQFRVSAAESNAFTGLSGVFAVGIAGIIGGALIRLFKMQPRSISFSILGSQLFWSVAVLYLLTVSCESPRMAGQIEAGTEFNITSDCSSLCRCDDMSFTPVCDPAQQLNYFSPCRAGCSTRVNESTFSDCTCLDTSTAAEVTRGWCEGSCSDFMTYIYVKAVAGFVGGLPIVGGTMLLYRIVEPELKSLATGVIGFSATIIAFLPAPILMGAIVDSTCIQWNSDCGSAVAGVSNCLMYDTDLLRYRFHMFVGALRLFGAIFDALVLWRVWNMRFHKEGKEANDAEVDEDGGIPMG